MLSDLDGIVWRPMWPRRPHALPDAKWYVQPAKECGSRRVAEEVDAVRLEADVPKHEQVIGIVERLQPRRASAAVAAIGARAHRITGSGPWRRRASSVHIAGRSLLKMATVHVWGRGAAAAAAAVWGRSKHTCLPVRDACGCVRCVRRVRRVVCLVSVGPRGDSSALVRDCGRDQRVVYLWRTDTFLPWGPRGGDTLGACHCAVAEGSPRVCVSMPRSLRVEAWRPSHLTPTG